MPMHNAYVIRCFKDIKWLSYYEELNRRPSYCGKTFLCFNYHAFPNYLCVKVFVCVRRALELGHRPGDHRSGPGSSRLYEGWFFLLLMLPYHQKPKS